MKHSPVCIWNGRRWAEVGRKVEALVPDLPAYAVGEWTLLHKGRYWGGLFKSWSNYPRDVRWTIKSEDGLGDAVGTYKQHEIESVLRSHGLQVEGFKGGNYGEDSTPRFLTKSEILSATRAVRHLSRAA